MKNKKEQIKKLKASLGKIQKQIDVLEDKQNQAWWQLISLTSEPGDPLKPELLICRQDYKKKRK
jgi:hypothetical protein